MALTALTALTALMALTALTALTLKRHVYCMDFFFGWVTTA